MIFSITIERERLRKDVLLLYVYLPVKKPNVVSPLQIMKGLFLASQELEIPEFYRFTPYLYGPCSFQVYGDINNLLARRLISVVSSDPTYYRVSPKGERKSQQLLEKMDSVLVRKLRKIKKLVVNKTFIELLKHVYEKYPEYAVNSIVDTEVL